MHVEHYTDIQVISSRPQR